MDLKRITPVIILLPILFIWWLYKTMSGAWTSFSMIFILVFLFITCVAVVIERILIRDENGIKIWIIESILILLITIGYLYYNSKFYFIISDNVNWFVVVDSEESNTNPVTVFPYSKSLDIKNAMFVNLKIKGLGHRKMIVKNRKSSIIYSMQKKTNTKGCDYTLFVIYPYSLSLDDDIFIKEKMEKLTE